MREGHRARKDGKWEGELAKGREKRKMIIKKRHEG